MYNFDPDLPTLFPVGLITFRDGTDDLLGQVELWESIHVHQTGQWHNMTPDEQFLNHIAADMGFGVKTAYDPYPGLTIWLTTEPDRSRTFITLPRKED